MIEHDAMPWLVFLVVLTVAIFVCSICILAALSDIVGCLRAMSKERATLGIPNTERMGQ
jgi:hypothetical protein